jgi:hypothetical protein
MGGVGGRVGIALLGFLEGIKLYVADNLLLHSLACVFIIIFIVIIKLFFYYYFIFSLF